MRNELSGSRFIRLHVDENETESTLVFPYFTEDLLSFVRRFSVPICQARRVLYDVLQGIKALHGKD